MRNVVSVEDLDLHRLALLLGSRRPLTSSLSSAGAL